MRSQGERREQEIQRVGSTYIKGMERRKARKKLSKNDQKGNEIRVNHAENLGLQVLL